VKHILCLINFSVSCMVFSGLWNKLDTIHFWISIKWLGLSMFSYYSFISSWDYWVFGLCPAIPCYTQLSEPFRINLPLHCMYNQECIVPCFHLFTAALWGRMTLWLCQVAWIHNWTYSIFLNDEFISNQNMSLC
jgi:hypothetical protein